MRLSKNLEKRREKSWLLISFDGTPIIMVIGIIGTVITIAILSIPCHIDESFKQDKKK